MTRFTTGCLSPLLLALTVSAGTANAQDVPERVEQHLGDFAILTLKEATRVQVFRIKPEQGKPSEGISGYPIVNEGKQLGKDFAGKMSALLFRESTHFGEGDRCFTPGVAFRLWRDNESVEVIVCFACDKLHIVTRDDKKAIVKQVSGAFGPDNRALLRLAKEAFPADAEVQAIKEKK